MKEIIQEFEEEFNQLTRMGKNQYLSGYRAGSLDRVADIQAYTLLKKVLKFEEEEKMEKLKKPVTQEEPPNQEQELKVIEAEEVKERKELAIPEREKREMTLQETLTLGKVLWESRFFKDLSSASQAVAKILAGRELGLPPMISLSTVYVVNGRVSIEAKVAADLIKRSGEYDYLIKRQDNKGAAVQFLRNGKPIPDVFNGVVTFTEEDAARANLLGKIMYKQYPSTMYLWRAIIFGARKYCPHLLHGAYTHEEMGIEINRDGTNIIEEPVVDTQGSEITETPAEKRKEELAHYKKELGIDKLKKLKAKLKIEGEGGVKNASEKDYQKYIEGLKQLLDEKKKTKKEKVKEKEKESSEDDRRVELKPLKEKLGIDKLKEVWKATGSKVKALKASQKDFDAYITELKKSVKE